MSNVSASMNSVLPAFPVQPDTLDPSAGLTKREYFAAMAMQGMLASESDESAWTADKVSIRSVKFADALLAELAKVQS